jgi:uncharacterized membrane protein
MKIKSTDVVAEYLHEVDLRLTGLPVLQRRELLADLAAHIATERTERDIKSEGELIEVLERLGNPEEVANAAYEEAGTRPPRPAAKQQRNWIPAAIGAGVVLLVLVVCGFFAFFATSGHSEPVQTVQVPAGAPR